MALSIGVALLVFEGLQSATEVEFDAFALGEATGIHYARIDDVPVHCSGVEEAPSCLRGLESQSLSRSVLWLGNSQLHGINQLRPGDVNAATHLWSRLETKGFYLQTYSFPNANLQEHFTLATWLFERMPVEVLLVSLVYDDTREDGLRDDIASALVNVAVATMFDKCDLGRALLKAHAPLATGDAADDDLAGLDQTIQQGAEAALVGWLEDNSDLWARRKHARGKIFVELDGLRNWAFGIDAQTIRRKIPACYQRNLQALEQLVSDAKQRGVTTVLYIAPIRQDVPISYVVSDYNEFKSNTKAIAERFGASWIDLDNIVPAEMWGTTTSRTSNRKKNRSGLNALQSRRTPYSR